ncbi:MAG: hypothetical protein K2P94_17225 [Rhodospirillaceae bacterium]|nr:hypothetical protein [Rhodospirillaceae bacterium]
MPERPKTIRPVITTLAEWAVDDALALQEKHPEAAKRRRLPVAHYKSKLSEEAPKTAPKKSKSQYKSKT